MNKSRCPQINNKYVVYEQNLEFWSYIYQAHYSYFYKIVNLYTWEQIKNISEIFKQKGSEDTKYCIKIPEK